MSSNKHHRRSQLFTVRIWVERVGRRFETRGRIQHTQTGDGRYFRTWSELVAFLQEAVQAIVARGDDR